MSGTATWLHTQRKTELVELANKVGLKGYSDLKKADLETALDTHMRANQTTLSKDTSLAPYYKRIESTSPMGKEIAVATKTPKPRRVTKTKEELEAEVTGTSSSVSKTPKNKLPLAATIPLPPSPAVIASHVERQTARARSSLNKVYKQSGLVERTDSVRDFASSTAAIQIIVTLVELYGLHFYLVPWKSVFEVPASYNVATGQAFPFKLPDFFNMLSPNFWSVLLTWVTTHLLLPYAAAYFFNLTQKAKQGIIKTAKSGAFAHAQYDHLTYNIAKALVAYVVYSQHFKLLGFPSSHAIEVIQSHIVGGYNGVLITSAIGVLTSLYEAILRR